MLCKNKRPHRYANLVFGHEIPLGVTDPYVTPPALGGPFTARRGECGKERSYEPDEVLRRELDSLRLSSPTHCLSSARCEGYRLQ